MAQSTRTRSPFRAAEPIASRPEERIAARTAERRAARGARPARSRLTLAILIVGGLGLLDATWLTYIHYFDPALLNQVCSVGHTGQSSCSAVQASQWSKLLGIPVALIGLIGYVFILGSLRVRGELGRAAGFGAALIGFLFSLWLTSREAFSLHKYCEYCLFSAGCLTVLAVLTAIRFLRTPPGTP